MLQTPDYARAVLSRAVEPHRSPRYIKEAVRTRIRRQKLLYQPGRRYHILLWEGVLRTLLCPPAVLAAQLDRLAGVIGLDTVELGIVPFTATLKQPPAVGFWIYVDRQVIVETWHAELWLDDAETVAMHLRAWEALRDSVLYGTDAHRTIARARTHSARRETKDTRFLAAVHAEGATMVDHPGSTRPVGDHPLFHAPRELIPHYPVAQDPALGDCRGAARVHASTLKLPVWHRPEDSALAGAYAAALAKVARHYKDLL
ncbi:DUF5753 domain-containing protein [Streptomyces sp. CMB-StM0423]|uniref:DUF5753 domain-containing protein n=1 Tax=Streptomyces sp. CMB-StM0423 TaxID=2059884 RepID=UPI00268E795F